jgi:predicted ABC-type exoprotein transport system permease subunit
MNFTVLVVPLVAGILLGYFLREKRKVNLGKVTLGIILVLIFSLGFGIGSNSELLNSLPEVGWSAIVIASVAIVFSVIFVKVARRTAGLD